MFKKLQARLLMVGSVAFLAGGCSTPQPAEMALCDRDQGVYKDQGAIQQKQEKKLRVAVLVSQNNFKNATEAATALDSTLTSALSDFAFFQIVERSNLGALQQEAFIRDIDKNTDNAPVTSAADYLISAKITNFEIVDHVPTSQIRLWEKNNAPKEQRSPKNITNVSFSFFGVKLKITVKPSGILISTRFSCRSSASWA